MNDGGVYCPACGKPTRWNPEPEADQLVLFRLGEQPLRAVCFGCGRAFVCEVDLVPGGGILRQMKEVQT